MRLLIIDDHESFLQAVAAMLRHIAHIEVTGLATGGRRGLELASELKPEVVLVDYNMPEIDGIEVTRRLKAGPNPPKVVMMSFQTDPEYQALALGAGADAFIPKTELHTGLAPLLTRMGHGPG